MEPINLTHNGYLVTTDKALMHPADVYQWLSELSYWSQRIPWATFMLGFDNCFAIGVIKDGRQVGFARLITDYATFGYLADVYVEEPHRGLGLSKIMMQELFALNWVKGLRRIMLATQDAHGLYRQVGFTPLAHPERLMEIVRPGIYEKRDS